MKISFKNSPFLILFWLVAIVLSLAHLIQNTVLIIVSAPLLNLFLLLHYKHIKGHSNAFSFALIFCLLGDCTLLIDHFNYFISGLTAYWGACILFGITILKRLEGNLMVQIQKKKALLPLGLYGVYLVALMFLIHSFMGELFYPTLLYSISLSLTCGLSGLLWLEKRNSASKNVFYGCVLLSLCASLIGLNKFVFSDPTFRFLEVLFYAPSLYFLYLGFNDPFFDENI